MSAYIIYLVLPQFLVETQNVQPTIPQTKLEFRCLGRVDKTEQKSSQVSPNARRRAQCKGGGGRQKYRYNKSCTTYRRLSENAVATFTWNRNPKTWKQSRNANNVGHVHCSSLSRHTNRGYIISGLFFHSAFIRD